MAPGGPQQKADPQVAGALIGNEWLASAHNLRNAAACADCHEPDAQHPNQCYTCHGGTAVTKNPDLAGKCAKCHGPSKPSDAMMALAPQHYGYSTASALPAARRASYVSGQYQGRCRACHNPHLRGIFVDSPNIRLELPDPQGRQRKIKRICARINTHGVFDAAIRRELFLEFPDLGSHDERSLGNDLRKPLVDAGTDNPVLFGKINERYAHDNHSSRALKTSSTVNVFKQLRWPHAAMRKFL